jgi:hypothetical protein
MDKEAQELFELDVVGGVGDHLDKLHEIIALRYLVAILQLWLGQFYFLQS